MTVSGIKVVDLLDLDIYAESNNGPIEFEMTGREKTISGEEALQISTMSSRQKTIIMNIKHCSLPDYIFNRAELSFRKQ